MKHTFLLFILLILFTSSCKQLKVPVTVDTQPQPTTFSSSDGDTIPFQRMPWKKYYKDTLLIALIDEALIHNFDLLEVVQRIEIAKAGVKNAQGALLPQLSPSINGGMRRFGLYTMDGAGNITTEITPGQIVPINLPDIFIGTQASWEVDIWGKLRNAKQANLASVLAEQEVKNTITTNLVHDIAQAYFELIALDIELKIIQDFIKKQEEALEVAKIKMESARGNQLAVEQFRAQLLNAQALEYEYLQSIVETENLINFLIGRYPQKIERSDEELFSQTPEIGGIGTPQQLLLNRPDIREATMRVQINHYNRQSAKAAFYPNLDITAGFGYQAFDPSLLFLTPTSIAYTLLGGLTAPLLNRKALKAAFETATAEQKASMIEYNRTLTYAVMEVNNVLSEIKNIDNIHRLKTEQELAAESAVAISMELFNTGKADYLDFIFAQQNALQVQIELIEIKQRRWSSRAKLYKHLGGGW